MAIKGTSASNYGSTGSSQPLGQGSVQMDPLILARTMQAMSSQIAANQSTQQVAPKIAYATVQRTLAFPEGQYEGETQDDLPHGRGTLTYHPGKTHKKYEGEWKNGQFDGEGVLKFSNGSRLEGRWKEGQLHGKGIESSASGATYEGGFCRGKYHGKGTYRFADGTVHEGGWKNGDQHGQGKYTKPNGSCYSGGFLYGKPHGQGTYTDPAPDGDDYTGEWKNGKAHGHGVRSDGTFTDKGTFRDGKLWTGTRRFAGKEFTYHGGVKENDCCALCSIQ